MTRCDFDADIGVNGSGVFGHFSRYFAQARGPFCGVELKRGRGGEKFLGLFDGEIVRPVCGSGAKLFVGLDADQALRGAAIDAIGGQPHGLADRIGIVVEGNSGGEREAHAVVTDAAIIIEFRGTDADGDIQNAVAVVVLCIDRTTTGEDDVVFLVGDFVAEEIRRGVGLCLRAVKFRSSSSERIFTSGDWARRVEPQERAASERTARVRT